MTDLVKDAESAIWEARARIMWGESPAEVRNWLLSKGVDQTAIDDLIRISLFERKAKIRKQGIGDLIIGGGIVAACALVIWLMIAGGVVSRNIFVFSIAGGFYGAYRMSQGFGWLISSGSTEGSLDDLH